MAGKGLFVTIEGCEGAGKSTQAALLADKLEESGREVLLTREPGGTAISEKIRAILLDTGHSEMAHRVELLLYLASRAQLVEEVVRPALERGWVVISDRFHDSTLAYQGGARNLDIDRAAVLNEFATGGLVPDVTFLLDLPAEQGMERKNNDGDSADRMEGQGIGFHARVREAFLELARREPDRIVVLDAGRPVDELASEIAGRVTELLE